MKKSRPNASERRAMLREELWPNSKDRIWSPDEDGYCTMPRSVPLIATLMNIFSSPMNVAPIYLDLWGRNYPEALIEIPNEQDIAAACGFSSGTRAVRSWRERLFAIRDLGFIEIKSKGTRQCGYVLMLHPYGCVDLLRTDKNLHIPQWWSELYSSRLREIGAPARFSANVSPNLKVPEKTA